MHNVMHTAQNAMLQKMSAALRKMLAVFCKMLAVFRKMLVATHLKFAKDLRGGPSGPQGPPYPYTLTLADPPPLLK